MTKERVSELLVERLALGELAPEAAARVRAALGDEAEAQLAALAKDDAEILARLPPAMVAAEVKRRLARAEAPVVSAGPRWWVPASALVAAGALAWWFTRMPVAPHDPDGDGPLPAIVDPSDGGLDELPEVVRIKGDVAITIDRLGPRGPERMLDGDLARAGDRLQLQYRAADREQGAIVSIDGRGVATLHFPADVGASPQLRGGGAIALDHSYELDDAPSFERFFFVTAVPGVTLRVDAVMRAAELLARGQGAADGELVLPAGYEQQVLMVRKSER